MDIHGYWKLEVGPGDREESASASPVWLVTPTNFALGCWSDYMPLRVIGESRNSWKVWWRLQSPMSNIFCYLGLEWIGCSTKKSFFLVKIFVQRGVYPPPPRAAISANTEWWVGHMVGKRKTIFMWFCTFQMIFKEQDLHCKLLLSPCQRQKWQLIIKAIKMILQYWCTKMQSNLLSLGKLSNLGYWMGK